MLKVGFASRCITPAPGKEIPGLFERRLAQGTADDLFTRAVVIDDGEQCAALAQTDAITVPEGVVADARRTARLLCGIPEKQCFIAATHTHSGGPIFGGFMSEGDPAYAPFVADQIGTAIAEAHRLLRPALVGTGADQARGVAFNRRFWMKDGTTRTHPGKMNPDIDRPAGPEDATVTVVGFADPNTFKPIGGIVHFACHATHMNGYLYSADYVRWIVDTLRAVHGPDYGVVYLNGACGDVTQMDNRSPRSDEFGPYWCERTGRVIAGGAIQALARIDYFRKASVDTAATRLRIAIRPISAADRQAAKALLRKHEVTAVNVETIYARELLEVDAMRRRQPKRTIEIMGVRIADAMFWSVPGEYFQEFALQVRAASPFPHTCCVELANGYNGYICTRDAFGGGGYEIRTARSSFLESSAGEKIAKTGARLSRDMHAKAVRELRALPRRRTWPVYDDPSVLDGIRQLKK